MIKNDLIIRTKLRRPFTRSTLVPRPQLQLRIVKGLSGPLTLVTAPAGFGKTTLVASTLAGCGIPVVWLSLDREDNQPGRFLHYLAAALNDVDETIGNAAAQLMSGLQQAPADVILTSLVNDLGAVDREIALVLDDYQLINSQAVHEAVVFILDYRPENFHLVIATRSDPPLPLARLRARGQVVELRADDLRFTEPEADAFLNGVMGLHLDTGSITVLEERTEGWVAGLQMAALSMQDRKDVTGFIAGFSGTNRYILDYLLEEVLASQPAEIQHFLLQTSILERLTAPLCDAILEGDDGLGPEASDANPAGTRKPHASATILESLERQNLFVVPLDDERNWYRYHHLFADLLKVRLHQNQPELIPGLHKRASAWLEDKGLIADAIHHLFAAQEMNRAADLIELYGPACLSESDPSIFQLADSLPQDLILARPKIGLYQAWLFIIQARIAKALPILNGIVVAENANPGINWIQTIALTALAFLSPPSNIRPVVPLPDYQNVEAIPEEELILRNAADLMYCMALARRGNLDGAVDLAVKCLEREEKIKSTRSVPTLGSFLTRLLVMQGKLKTASALSRRYLDPAQLAKPQFIYTNGSMKIDLGEVLSEWNCLDEAEESIREGLTGNESWHNIMTDGFGLGALIRVLLAKGDTSGALKSVEQLESRMRESAQPREFDEDVRTLRIRVQLANGDLQAPVQWADQIVLSEDYSSHPEIYRLTLARIRLAQGRCAEVESLLSGTMPPPAPGSQISRQIETNLLLARAVAGQKRLSEAMQLLETCLALAEPEGYVRVFIDGGRPIQQLLVQWLESAKPGPLRDHAIRVLTQFDTGLNQVDLGQEKIAPSDELADPLTPRELDVLSLLAAGLSNRQIASKLVLAEGTVKYYVHTVLEKLGVRSRTQAGIIARERNLV